MKKPNVIIIFTDDMGYGDMGCYGHPTINTPALDQLVAQGIKLTQFCVAASVCTPSRAGLLTGRYPVRYGLEQGVIHPDSHHGLPSEEVTIAELLKQDGYTTACIGKWHLGHRDGLLPTDQGFDYFYGIPFSNDMSRREQQLLGWESYHYQLPLMEQKDTLLLDPEQEYFTRHFTEKALRWLYQNKDKAFFLYLAHPMPHVPVYSSHAFQGKSKRGSYGDAIEEIDWSVGKIIVALRELGLDKNTLVIFSSDNGPWLYYKEQSGSAGLLRNGKGTTYEGGFRVPCVLWGPGVIPFKRVEQDFVSALDVLPTIAGLIGLDTKALNLDGRDLSSTLLNATAPKEKPFYYYSKAGVLEGVRSGVFKLLKKESGIELYNLEVDPSEKYNLAGQDSITVHKLLNLLRNFQE